MWRRSREPPSRSSTNFGRSSMLPLSRLSFPVSADLGSTDDLEVENGLLECTEQPQPYRQQHLGTLRLRLRVITAHKHGVVGLSELSGVDHEVSVHVVQGFDHLRLGEPPLDLLSEGVGIRHRERGRHTLREVQRVGDVYEDLAVQVFRASEL